MFVALEIECDVCPFSDSFQVELIDEHSVIFPYLSDLNSTCEPWELNQQLLLQDF